MKLVYYAHPVSDYDTDHEIAGIRMLEKAGFVVLNPNNPATALEYKLAKVEDPDKAMEVFYRLIDRCDVLVFQSFEDNMISSGVSLEIDYARFHARPVFEMPYPNVLTERALTREETVKRVQALRKAR